MRQTMWYEPCKPIWRKTRFWRIWLGAVTWATLCLFQTTENNSIIFTVVLLCAQKIGVVPLIRSLTKVSELIASLGEHIVEVAHHSLIDFNILRWFCKIRFHTWASERLQGSSRHNLSESLPVWHWYSSLLILRVSFIQTKVFFSLWLTKRERSV